MDLLEEPDIKKAYEKCKYIVKVWEHKFKKRYNRLPSKLDIKEANREVRNAYKKYFHLKIAALEQSFQDVEGFEDEETDQSEQSVCESFISADRSPNRSYGTPEILKQTTDLNSREVWGTHLNHQKEVSKENPAEEKLNLNSSITMKLFCGSKFTKRNPRKSLSFSQKNKSETKSDSQISFSQPTIVSEDYSSFISKDSEISRQSISSREQLFSQGTLHVEPFTDKVVAKPINIIQSMIDNEPLPKQTKAVDTGWLERIERKAGLNHQDIHCDLPPVRMESEVTRTETTKVDYDSEDIIEESDEEGSCREEKLLHTAKKRKINVELGNIEDIKKVPVGINTHHITTEIIDNENQTAEKCKSFQNSNSGELTSINCNDRNVCDESNKENSITQIETNNFMDNMTGSNNEDTLAKKPTRRTKTPKKKTHSKAKQRNSHQKNKDENESPSRRSSRTTRNKANLREVSSGEEDAFYSETDELDPEYSPVKGKKKHFGLIFDSDSSSEAIASTQDNKKPIKRKKSTAKQNTKEVTTKSKKEKTGKVVVKKNVDENDDNESKSYELEFSVKPKIVAPRFTDIKKVLIKMKVKTGSDRKDVQKYEDVEKPGQTENFSFIKDKRQQAKEKLEKKIASGNLNENFVKIDIKKKVFVRGKHGRSFRKFKNAQWRSKKAKSLLDMGGCDGGMMACFTCGQLGHFASDCKATKGDGLLPLQATALDEDEESPFPTLEEAAEMAREGPLAVRKPKLAPKVPNVDGKDGNEDSLNCVIEENDGDVFDDDIDVEQLLAETLKLEEHIRKLDVQMYVDKVKVVEPYYKLNEDGSVIDTPDEVYEVLQRFGHSSFRPGQEKAVMRILSGKSTLVTLSTGSGKSLCYQLPAYLYSKREPCISLIISPLVSLMDDQVTGIAKFIKAGCLHSNQTKTQRDKILEAISMGELSVLLVSPEAVVAGEKQSGFGSFLRKLPPIAFACIDEAHCVSQWSHNFRPSYLMVCHVLREHLGVRTILGLTATATMATQDSIINHLRIPDGHNGVIGDVPLPDNLVLTVSKDGNREQALFGLLTSDRFSDCQSIIIYCTRREECERIATFLRTALKSNHPPTTDDTSSKKRKRLNLQAEPYHAGMSASRRRTIQKAFMSGELRIVVATVAFGMGINKADIRAVIHFNMPSSFESYVQEVGRAGRDGLPAQCHVFLDSMDRDENELRRHIHANSIDRHVIRKLLQKVFVACSCKGVCPKHEVAFSIESTVKELDIPEENISTLLCYLELHNQKYIELLSPAYTWCKIISYGGPLQIRKSAKDCPPLAMALALHKNSSKDNATVMEFPVVDVAATMGWESGICKHKLKNLEWTSVNNQPKRSVINVQFSDLGFRLLAPGNLTEDQLDEALDNLYNRVCDQERKALLQLHAIHSTLREVAKPSYRNCLVEDEDKIVIKEKVREYFNSPDPLCSVATMESNPFDEDVVIRDIHALVSMYRDNSFTGRSVARIFHGIQSPNYPAYIWGRCRFWRSHIDKDFHKIIKIATNEIIKLR